MSHPAPKQNKSRKTAEGRNLARVASTLAKLSIGVSALGILFAVLPLPFGSTASFTAMVASLVTMTVATAALILGASMAAETKTLNLPTKQ